MTLVADNTDISEGQSATLTAFASSPVDGSGYDIMIFGISPSYAAPHQVADYSSTSLSDLLRPGMGNCHWAACLYVR